jgi:ribonuclease HI
MFTQKMARKKKKYYVVWAGHEPGIYDSWTECHKQVKNYPGAKYKSFTSQQEAEDAFSEGYSFDKTKNPKTILSPNHPDIIQESWSVDAACSGNPGKMEYRGVFTKDGSQIFYAGPYKRGTNNLGEFLALVHACALLKKMGDTKRVIYSDSKIAINWLKLGRAKTKLVRDARTALLFEHLDRAEKWLESNTIENPILKWKTDVWGEIPADFGRK